MMKYLAEPKDPYEVNLPETVSQVLEYWDTQRGVKIAPSWGQFKLDELPPQAVPWCSVLDIIRDPVDFVFRFWGSARRDLLGQELTGKSLSTVENADIVRSGVEQHMMVLEQRKPLFFHLTAVPEHGEEIAYGTLRLPLSADGDTVDKIFNISFNPDIRSQLHSLFGTLSPIGLSN